MNSNSIDLNDNNETEESVEINEHYKKFRTDYFYKQLEKPYQSTEKFFDFLEKQRLIYKNTSLIDACCGSGVNSFYAHNRFTCNKIIGFDAQMKLINIGNKYLENNYNFKTNIEFLNLDLFKCPTEFKHLKMDGAICLQTLMLFKDWKKFLKLLSELNTNWIALSSLFYEGRIEVKQEFDELDENGESITSFTYTILSIPIVEKYLKKIGFREVYWEKFDIEIDLLRGDINQIGTYTVLTDEKKRLQMSGPMSMPWWFVIAKK